MREMTFRPRQETIKFHRFRIEKLDAQWNIAFRGNRRRTCQSRIEGKTTPSQAIEYRTALGREDLEAAFRLLHRRYCAVGLSSAYDRRMRILPFHFWDQTQVFVARRGAQVLGCITLITDCGPQKLPIESMYPDSFAPLHRSGERIGEITSLAIEPGCSESSSRLFGELTRRTMFFARAAGLTRLAAVVHPRHAKFYRHAMGFDIIGGLARVDHVEGQPGVPILGTVNDPTPYREKWRQFYFDGSFPIDEIRARPMHEIDRHYFGRYAARNVNTGSITSKAA
tara:strand:- start:11568 stop:12413 length:846 start_codon:yes stop_codon:yes gene_type:complete